MKLSPRWMLLCLTVVVMTACSQVHSLSFAPVIPGYSEESARYISLGKKLREISGLAWFSNKELLAINDEQGKIFFVDSETGEFTETSFGKKGDYEDVVFTPSAWYVLKSDGAIHQVDPSTRKETNVYTLQKGKGFEFESLAYDAASQKLLMICKTCGRDAQDILGWWFDTNTRQFDDTPAFVLPLKHIRSMAKDNTLECEPSAAAFHPVTGELYIIASVGRVLLICDKPGQLKSIHRLNPYQFQQPEGLCFSPSGDLFISNEGRKSRATLLYYPYLTP